ncbi:hypothetical protein EWM64_g7361 [Hericium alpestre]|uniref:Uncharacterized protein n=1 Tax=Hericium alpestre TaxID=135208 RepID=A0A4Y9ZPF0_9AGAM|nr:hypothetical protein EWM64_g7361 [Hericium alpestre]
MTEEPTPPSALSRRRRRKIKPFCVNSDDDACSISASEYTDGEDEDPDRKPANPWSYGDEIELCKDGQGAEGPIAIVLPSELPSSYIRNVQDNMSITWSMTSSVTCGRAFVDLFTYYRELREAHVDVDFERVLGKLIYEWYWIGGSLIAVAALDTAIFGFSPDAIFSLDGPAKRSVTVSSIACAIGLFIDMWLIFAYSGADVQKFQTLAVDLYSSWFFFALTSRLPLLALVVAVLALVVFLLVIAWDAWRGAVLVMSMYRTPFINKLPDELLAEIFSLARDPLIMRSPLACEPLGSKDLPYWTPYPIRIANVSRRWRNIAVTMPNLWSQLSFADTDATTALFLARAGNAPLDMVYDADATWTYPSRGCMSRLHTSPADFDRLSLTMLALTSVFSFAALGVACVAAAVPPRAGSVSCVSTPLVGTLRAFGSDAVSIPPSSNVSLLYASDNTVKLIVGGDGSQRFAFQQCNSSFVDRPTIVGPVDVTYFGRIVPLNGPNANACLTVPLGFSASPYSVQNGECSDVDDQSQLTQYWMATDGAEAITLVGSTASGATYKNDGDGSFSMVLVEEDGQQVVKVAITNTDDRLIDIRFN